MLPGICTSGKVEGSRNLLDINSGILDSFGSNTFGTDSPNSLGTSGGFTDTGDMEGRAAAAAAAAAAAGRNAAAVAAAAAAAGGAFSPYSLIGTDTNCF